MRWAFLGAGAFGLPSLAALGTDASLRLVGVVTQPDRPAGRGRAMTPTPIGEFVASESGVRALGGAVPLLKPADVNAPDVLATIASWHPDVLVVIAFGQKLGPGLLALPSLGRAVPAMNLHASLLPRWRGAAPINAAILAGDAETGNSVITIAPRMDAGLVLGESRRAIDPLVTAGELHDTLAQDGPALLAAVLAQVAAGTAHGQVQDESLVTKARKLSKADDAADFSRSAEELRRRVHGLTPWPGITIELDGRRLKVLRVAAEADAGGGAPGALVDVAAGRVACGTGAVRLLEVQPAGGTAMAWEQYARGAGRSLVRGAMVRGGPWT